MSAKTILLKSARALGLFSFVLSSQWRQARLLIICYHGVSIDDEHEWDPELYITTERLRERLCILKKYGCAILPLKSALQRMREGTLPPRAVAITFDDGAVDFFERAVPVLREFEVPVTLYLTTYYCLHQLPVFDTAISYIIWKGRHCKRDLSDLVGVADISIETADGRALACSLLREYASRETMNAYEKDTLLRRVAEALDVDFEAFVTSRLLCMMSPEQVRGLPSDLVDVELHTHRHRTPRNRAAFVRELNDNQSAIASLTGNLSQRRHFCYPSGDYTADFIVWLRDQGIESATTCVPGLSARDSEPLLLPRFVDSTTATALSFEAWVSGFAELLPRRAEYRLDARRLVKTRGDKIVSGTT